MTLSSDDDLSQWRREYADGGLDESALADDPISQFRIWISQAHDAGISEPNAMVLGTVDGSGRPRQRTVLLKHVDDDGFRFFTNYESAKATDIAGQSWVSLLFGWYPIHRQVIVSGRAHRVDRAETEEYFATRPRGSQLAAWASPQSRPLIDRSELEAAWEQTRIRFTGEVPAPPHWGGFCVVPQEVEFWAGRPNRLHDRLRFHRGPEGGWVVHRVAP